MAHVVYNLMMDGKVLKTSANYFHCWIEAEKRGLTDGTHKDHVKYNRDKTLASLIDGVTIAEEIK